MGAMRRNSLAALVERVEGAVAMQVVVKTDGRIGDVRVVRSLHRDLDEAAVDATRQWRFEPGTLNLRAVPVAVTIEMTFTLRDRR